MRSSMDCLNVVDDASGFYSKGTNVSTKENSNTHESNRIESHRIESLTENLFVFSKEQLCLTRTWILSV